MFQPEPRISLVTLAVADVDRAVGFYTGLGWRPAFQNDEVAFYQLGGLVLSLWHRPQMAAELGLDEAALGPGGMEVAHNVRTRDEVDPFLQAAEAAGARIVVPAKDTTWGGRSGHFADPDGHRWEVAWNPAWILGADGSITIP